MRSSGLALLVGMPLLSLPSGRAHAGADPLAPSTRIVVSTIVEKGVHSVKLLSGTKQVLAVAGSENKDAEELWTFPVDGGEGAKRLEGPRGILVSPDELWAAYEVQGPSTATDTVPVDVHLVDLKTFTARALTQDGKSKPLGWSRDGRLEIAKGTLHSDEGGEDFETEAFEELSVDGSDRRPIARSTLGDPGVDFSTQTGQERLTVLVDGATIYTTVILPTDGVWYPTVIRTHRGRVLGEEYLPDEKNPPGRFRLSLFDPKGLPRRVAEYGAYGAQLALNPAKTVVAIGNRSENYESVTVTLAAVDGSRPSRKVLPEFRKTGYSQDWPDLDWAKDGSYLVVHVRHGLFKIAFSAP